MLPLSNIHTHTTFADGKNPAEDMVQAALALGFHTLGFSEHGYADYDDAAMPAEVEPAYRAEILRLKEKYRDRIHILLGYEHDWLSPIDFSPYEYAIESVHYLKGGAVCVDHSRQRLEADIREYYAGDPYALCRDYFCTVSESCEKSPAQVAGHIDLVTKFNERRDLFDDEDPRFLRYALECAETAAKSGKVVEVNTGAIARGYRTQPYPGPAMLRRVKEAGGRVMLSSDCHNADFLTCGFEDAAALLKRCGFKTAWMMQGNEWVEYALEGTTKN